MPWACSGVRGGYSCLGPDGRFCLCFSAATEKVDFLTPPESDQSRRSSLWVPYVTLLRGFGVFSDPIGLEKELYTTPHPDYRKEPFTWIRMVRMAVDGGRAAGTGCT